MDGNDFGVPAGWYPDPLGLPQLRWWDSQAWTEHTSEARAPIVIQPATATSTRLGWADDDLPARVAYADEDLPSRREQRERERRERDRSFAEPLDTDAILESEADAGRNELSAQPLLAMTLKELEPPLTETVDDVTPGPRRASSHANAVPVESVLTALADDPMPQREPKAMRTYTAIVWIIALMPVIQLVVSIVLLLTGLGGNYPLFILVWTAPYLIVLGFAAFDRLVLQLWGHSRPASAWWALLLEPGYLVARAVRTYRETGKGFAPLAVFAASVVSVLAGILIVPGLVIAAFPAAFAAEAAQSVEADARGLLGAELEVNCPAPPVLVGDSVTCERVSLDGGTDSVVVELARRNGWIAWEVTDWGITVVD
ncbi:hypothetical protein M2152_000031 [Microbacteriaceae bacterium SG_E_30_P1]|uniref:DUF2510 domain-containing protein n=1 Tax=Antiquaquibacter oligotrophicus TaxID=2880260 RepID=A0ABT6KIU0_9MICO|nr:DUF2510 domain-containing protein [Antiquaquibacter oligotrophicus]MDH6179849.1 hypothetical protein [Antiquaquibacter oligotrophicus]UDF14390.1 DUF2510 domain-containing protein [Antiquaquibacter oligotrophicus]